MANTAILQELHFSHVVKRIKRITVERILRRVLKNNLKRWICFYKWVPSAPHFMVSNVAIKSNEKPCAQKQENSTDKKNEFFRHIKVLQNQILYAAAPQ